MFFPTSIHPRSSPPLYPPNFMFSVLDKQTKDTKAKKKIKKHINKQPSNSPKRNGNKIYKQKTDRTEAVATPTRPAKIKTMS